MRIEPASRSSVPNVVSEPIAAGGMASVHLVARGADGQLFALKRLHPHLANDEYFMAMLFDEATVASSIRHENVVTTHGLDVYEGQPCIVMDYAPGLSVADVICHAHPVGVPVPFALKIAADALRGLHAAHEACDEHGRPLEIVHRDVSPQNILVGTDGVARVLDFGIAMAAHRVHSTRPGDVKGKLSYMSPEHLMGARVDRRTDVRAVGVVLWEMLTASPLFHSKREQDTIEKIIKGRIPPPSERRTDIPAELDAVVGRALARNPEYRFDTALEMAEAIEDILVQYPVTSAHVAHWIQTLGAEELCDRERISTELVRAIPLPPTRVRARPSQKRPLTKRMKKLVEPALYFLSAMLISVGAFYLTRARIILK